MSAIMSRGLVVFAVIFLSGLTQANADVIGSGNSGSQGGHPLSPQPTPSPTPEPILPPTVGKDGVDKAGNCSDDYIQAYAETATEMNTLSAYAKNNEMPPNLFESVLSCTKLQSTYLGVVCNVPSIAKQAKSIDFAETCTAVREIYKNVTGQEAPAEVPVIQDVTDESPVALIKAAGLSIRVGNVTQFQKMLTKPGMTYAINGTVYDLKSSLAVESKVRCVLVASSSTQSFQNGQSLNVNKAQETFSNGYRETLLTLEQGTLGIDCVSNTGAGLTFGELKTAFGSLLQISFKK
jgi:hypothetical protein